MHNSTQQAWLRVARWVSGVVAWALIMPWMTYKTPTGGLDPSWRIGLALAVREHFVFGRDIIFNYGPLGYLATRVPVDSQAHAYLFIDLLTALLVAAVLVYVLRRISTVWQLFLLLVVALILQTQQVAYESSITTLLFLFCIFALFIYVQTPSWPALVSAGLVSILLFYIKLNTGLPAVLLMGVVLGYELLLRRAYPWPRLVLGALLFVIVLVASAQWLHTDLPAYLQSSWYLISGYNDAMYSDPLTLPNGKRDLIMAVSLLASFALVAMRAVWQQFRKSEAWIVHGLTAFFLFEIFKHGFGRGDHGHIPIFFVFAPAMLGLLALQPWAKRRSLTAVFGLALIFCGVSLGLQPILAPALTKLSDINHYIAFALNPPEQPVPAFLRQNHALPPQVLQRIGDAGVDVIPWEIATIYANDLVYTPRPMIQSPLVSNEFLDSKNAAKYQSDSAPGYIIFSSDELDGRLPFSTEGRTKLAVLTRYKPQTALGGDL